MNPSILTVSNTEAIATIVIYQNKQGIKMNGVARLFGFRDEASYGRSLTGVISLKTITVIY
jgi:hypothetical protein